MIELIAIIILILSIFGVVVIIFQKIPILAKLPEAPKGVSRSISVKIKNGIKNFLGDKNFDYERYLQKILSKFRILALKTESKTSSWLEKLRQNTRQKNGQKNDNYWEDLKKAKKG